MSLALVSIMRDEVALVSRWVAGVRRIEGVFDDVLVVDGGSADGTAEALVAAGVRTAVRPFPDDFAEQRNFAIAGVQGEWIFELDADEIPSVPLLSGLRQICANADAARIDCVGVPRLTFHDFVLVPGPGHRGLDFQYRLHRRHCYWRGRVHEEVVGFQARVELDVADGHMLLHMKDTARHVVRNEYYRRLGG